MNSISERYEKIKNIYFKIKKEFDFLYLKIDFYKNEVKVWFKQKDK